MFLEFVNDHIWWFLALAVIFNLLVMSVLRDNVKGANKVSALEMPALQRKGKSVIIDVNSEEQYSTSHIPKSINFALSDLNSENKSLLKHKDSTVVLVCQTGSQSTKAAKALVDIGFTKLHILNGGLVSWAKENMPLTSKS